MWKNIKDNLFEYSIGFIGFASLGIQFYIFKNEYNDKLEWISNFGDYFGFSAAFLSALVIVLLIRELKEQRESRVKLEESFDSNAATLKSVKEFFESQADYQKEQIEFIEQQKNRIQIENIRAKYDLHINNILYFSTRKNTVWINKIKSFNDLVDELYNRFEKTSDFVFASEVFGIFKDYEIEQLFISVLRMLDDLEKDIITYIDGNVETLISKDIDSIIIDSTKKEELLVYLEYLIKINSILNTEEKYIYLLYLVFYNKLNKSNYSNTNQLIFDDIRVIGNNQISHRNITNSNLRFKNKAEDTIYRILDMKINLS